MNLVISQLKDGENPFDFDASRDPWMREMVNRLKKQGYQVSEKDHPLHIDLKVTKLEPDYYLKGKMSFLIQQTCARCAELFPESVEHSFDLALVHAHSPNRQQLNSEESDEMDITFFDGNDIELDPLLEEQFVLSLPYQAFCRENCRGVCQQCGTNLNQKSCQCPKDIAVNPFSILQETLRRT